MNTSQLLITRNISRSCTLSLIVALLMAVASLAGVFFQSVIYSTEELRRSFVSNDAVNLFIGLPVLLGSMWLARRGKLMGLLFLPGALFYVTYNSITYAVAMPFTLQFMLALALVILSIYAIIELLFSIDSTSIQQQLQGRVPERFAGAVLAGFGSLFFLWRGSVVVQTLVGSAVLSKPELGVAVADVCLAPAWLIAGLLLWRKQAFGYVIGTGLLFQLSMLFIGLLVFFILQPIMSAVPFAVNDFIAIFMMGLVCFIPFGLFVRGILRQ